VKEEITTGREQLLKRKAKRVAFLLNQPNSPE
jgi:hypothetical protein